MYGGVDGDDDADDGCLVNYFPECVTVSGLSLLCGVYCEFRLQVGSLSVNVGKAEGGCLIECDLNRNGPMPLFAFYSADTYLPRMRLAPIRTFQICGFRGFVVVEGGSGRANKTGRRPATDD